jgi:glycosyltransferase involved in cell wall biosynthesis
VVAHFGSEPSTVALQAVGDLPLILSLHARDLYVEAEGLAEKLARAAATVTCTRANLDYLRAHFPAQASRCRLIYHGLPAAWLDAPLLPRLRPGGPLRILAVGRLVPKKGFAVLLEACARMGVAWELRVLGDGPGRRALAEDAERLRITRQVHFDGWASQDDVCEGYAWADVLACPSIIAPDGDRDGLPNVVVEAMATGLPVVGSAISGIPEAVLDGDTGFLVPPGDPVALAAALTRCGDAPLRARLGEAAAARARAHFDGERWLDALAHVIQGCVASCGSESSGG